MHGVLHQGLVLRGIPPGGVNGAVVMACKILEAPVDVRLISAGPGHRRFQVVRDDGLGHATVIVQGIGATSDQVLPFLAPAGLHVGILAIGQDGYEHFHRDYFPCGPVNNMELLAREVDEQFLAGVVLELHRALYLGILAPVVFQELGIAIGILGRLHIIPVMVEEGEAGVVPGLVDSLETAHELFVAHIVYGRMGGKEGLQGPIVEGQQFFKGAVAGPEKAHIGVYRITGYPEGGTYLTVAQPIEVQGNNLFQVHWIKCIGHIAYF